MWIMFTDEQILKAIRYCIWSYDHITDKVKGIVEDELRGSFNATNFHWHTGIITDNSSIQFDIGEIPYYVQFNLNPFIQK
jgi:hypothetical protein